MPNVAFKYRAGLPRDIKALANNQIFVPNKTELNDPFEGFLNHTIFSKLLDSNPKFSINVTPIFEQLLTSANNAGIYSLAKNVDNELLWAHYGNQHAGFAIEYDLDSLDNIFNYGTVPLMHKLEVDYKTSSPTFDFSLNFRNVADGLRKIIGTKSAPWAYEKEIRLLFEETGFQNISFKSVRAIYFGLRASPMLRNSVMSRLRGRKLRYFEIYTNDSEYKLRVREIDDFYETEKAYSPPTISYNEDVCTEPKSEIYSEHKTAISKIINEIRATPGIKKIEEVFAYEESGQIHLTVRTQTSNRIVPFRVFRFKKIEIGSTFQPMRKYDAVGYDDSLL